MLFRVETQLEDEIGISISLSSGIIRPGRRLTVRGDHISGICAYHERSCRLEWYFRVSGISDAVALSFVNTADDVLQARLLLTEGSSTVPIIAKIETATGRSRIFMRSPRLPTH